MHRPTVIESNGSETENLVSSVARLVRHTEGQKKNCRVTENGRGLGHRGCAFRTARWEIQGSPLGAARAQAISLRGVPATHKLFTPSPLPLAVSPHRLFRAPCFGEHRRGDRGLTTKAPRHKGERKQTHVWSF